MKGIRSWVLQDLPHVLPPKGLQLSVTRLHASTTKRRFWDFFEFTRKEEQCAASKKIPSASLLPSNEFESISNVPVGLQEPSMTSRVPVTTSTPSYSYRFEPNLTPRRTKLDIEKNFKQDDLTSSLDGNPVPKNLKWKLKGYKTLRHEQAGDFAFVPGGNSYDFDILPRNTYGQWVRTTNSVVPRQKSSPEVETNVLREEVATRSFEESKIKSIEETIECKDMSDSIVSPSKMGSRVECKTRVQQSKATRIENSMPTLTSKSIIMPIDQKQPQLKSEFSTSGKESGAKDTSMNQADCRSCQTSSPSPKNVQKPSPPSPCECAVKCLPAKKPPPPPPPPPPPVESCQQQKPPETCTTSKPTIEDPKTSVESEWISKLEEQQRLSNEVHVKKMETSTLQTKKTEVPSTTYFAPLPPRRPSLSLDSSLSKASNKVDVEKTLQSVPKFEYTSKNLEKEVKFEAPKSYKNTSPCAATLARLSGQQGGNQSVVQNSGSFGFNPSSMSGNSGNGGSRKPPAPPCPPSTAKRASSTLRKPSMHEVKERRSGSEKTTNSTSGISTSAVTSSSRRNKCSADDDNTNCSKQRRNTCERERENDCQRRTECRRNEKPKKTKKKPCKRYCCPELTNPMECRFDRKCPKKSEKKRERRRCPRENEDREECKGRRRERSCSRGNSRSRKERDPSCLPERTREETRCRRQESCGRRNRESQQEGKGREICTDPSRRRRDCEETDRTSCKRERRECSRGRSRDSCGRGQRREQEDRGGREICTKPRRGESCGKNEDGRRSRREGGRSCSDNRGRRSAGCNGRRDFSQSTVLGRSMSRGNVRSYSAHERLSSTVRVNETGQRRLYGTSDDSRTFGKKDPKPAPSCKSGGNDKSTGKCKRETTGCLSRKSAKTTGQTERNECRPSWEKSKTEKSKSDQYCAKKEASKGENKKEESTKDRADRELKEMRECKKDIEKKEKKRGGKETEAYVPKGLERVVSPCKLKQMERQSDDKKKDSGCSSKNFSPVLPILGGSYDLIGDDSSVLAMQENKPVDVSFTRSYSTNIGSNEESKLLELDGPSSCQLFGNDGDLDLVEVPLPVFVDIPEDEPEDFRD